MGAAEMLLGEGTKSKILDELNEGPRTARELAKKLGIQESAVRMHLERLSERGIVSPHFSREGVGRPRKRYGLTSEGFELFPRRYELMVDSVIQAVLEKEGEPYLAALFVRAADRFAERLVEDFPQLRTPPSDPERRLRLVARVLDSIGQKAEVVRDAKGPRLVRRNCIFRGSALAHSNLICEVFDRRLLQKLLGGGSVDLLSSVPRGAAACSHLIQLTSAAAE
ncbi:MAG: ArsR family transcriptional regulator [Euryarchaeota archaeon]|nr:ArsR family transcriptional regulator [Euryarchaeota archaeon]MDE1836179.1 ArsR family transcriptional regulator [Euryarchaeota archaeon]MDE1881865.1 ArsR family transcriptional regulator [Euryarchaeota archaeon]MDE2045458.1 ArsR family transcriptional regulator [Thermoplasmata archaeon]